MFRNFRPKWAPIVFAGACTNAADTAVDRPADSGFQPDRKPLDRIVLITLDTTRGDHFTAEHMPFLTARAAEGTVLANHWTQTWTYSGLGEVLTGIDPANWGTLSWERGEAGGESPRLDVAIGLAAEAFAASGWATAYWASNHVASDETALNRGYSTFNFFSATEPEAIVPDVVGWTESHEGKPQFLHVHLNGAHSPYDANHPSCAAEVAALDDATCSYPLLDPGTATIDASGDILARIWGPESPDYEVCKALIVAAYQCAVREQDAAIEVLWQALAMARMLDNALVVVTTDHGEGLLDPLLNHPYTLRSPVTQGLALFWAPGIVPPERIAVPTRQFDILPSMLDIAGESLDLALEGVPYSDASTERMLLQFWVGAVPGEAESSHNGGILYPHHYIQFGTGGGMYFNLEADPAEQFDLLPEGQSPPAELLSAVQAHAEITKQFVVVSE